MKKGSYFLHVIRKEMDRRPKISLLEYATVLTADPLVIEVDSGDGLILEFNHGDFVMPDYLILSAGDHLVIEPIGRGHQYAILYRLRGKLDEAVIGGANAKAVARVGDPLDLAFTLSSVSVGDHGSHSHTPTITNAVILSGSTKVKVD